MTAGRGSAIARRDPVDARPLRVHDAEGWLVAVGRGCYSTAPDAPAPAMTPASGNLGDVVAGVRDHGRTALIDLADAAAPREWSFDDLDRATSSAARGLLARGGKRRDRVAILSANRAEYLAVFLGAMRVGLVTAPLYRMNALWVSCVVAFPGRASVVLLPRFSARAYIDAIGRYRCTWLTAVPTMMALVLEEPAALAATDRSSVRRVMLGSAPLTRALIDRVKTACPGALVTNGWGTTGSGPVTFGPHPRGLPWPGPRPSMISRRRAASLRKPGPGPACVTRSSDLAARGQHRQALAFGRGA